VLASAHFLGYVSDTGNIVRSHRGLAKCTNILKKGGA
jgi:hypothetical protein